MKIRTEPRWVTFAPMVIGSVLALAIAISCYLLISSAVAEVTATLDQIGTAR